MNRFIAAKKLNYRDELVWYVSHQGRQLKCLWRRCPPMIDDNGKEYPDPKEKVELTFVAQWMDTKNVYRVYTLEFSQ